MVKICQNIVHVVIEWPHVQEPIFSFAPNPILFNVGIKFPTLWSNFSKQIENYVTEKSVLKEAEYEEDLLYGVIQ